MALTAVPSNWLPAPRWLGARGLVPDRSAVGPVAGHGFVGVCDARILCLQCNPAHPVGSAGVAGTPSASRTSACCATFAHTRISAPPRLPARTPNETGGPRRHSSSTGLTGRPLPRAGSKERDGAGGVPVSVRFAALIGRPVPGLTATPGRAGSEHRALRRGRGSCEVRVGCHP